MVPNNAEIGGTKRGALTVGAPFPVPPFVAMLASLEMGSQAHFTGHVFHSHVLPHDPVGFTHCMPFPEGILHVVLLDSLDILPSVRVCVTKKKKCMPS